MSTKLTFSRYKQLRWYSTKDKLKVVEPVYDKILAGELKHRTHPGTLKPRIPEHPKWLYNIIQTILKDESILKNSIYASGENLALHLKGRHPPPEEEDFQLKFKEVQDRMKENINIENLQYNKKAFNLLKTLLYHWSPIEYDKHTCLSYLISRSTPEYGVLYKIFNEIKVRDINFVPKSLFDFGSGVGTVMWAASQFWVTSIKEYYCVDSSAAMNELSQYIIKKTPFNINPHTIFYRQFFPSSPVPTYDIVVSAYSLFELPNQKSRIELLKKLWEKTSQYLIIIEQGTRPAFNLINEARNFILYWTEKDNSDMHVFSPCPHDLECPRSSDIKIPCNFEVVYLTLPIPRTSQYKRERYSYVVFKKGEKRSENDGNWPRIVQPVLKRSKHVICRMCTASGELQEHIFSRWKNGRETYRCAKSSEWGDRLPFSTEKTKEICNADIMQEVLDRERIIETINEDEVRETIDEEEMKETIDEEEMKETIDEERMEETIDEEEKKETINKLDLEETIEIIEEVINEEKIKQASDVEWTDVLPSNNPNKL